MSDKDARELMRRLSESFHRFTEWLDEKYPVKP